METANKINIPAQEGNVSEQNNAPAWRKSSSSSSSHSACVELAYGVDYTGLVRDSKHPEGGQLAFPAESFQQFIAAAAIQTEINA